MRGDFELPRIFIRQQGAPAGRLAGLPGRWMKLSLGVDKIKGSDAKNAELSGKSLMGGAVILAR